MRRAIAHPTSTAIGVVGLALLGVLALARLPGSALRKAPPLRLVLAARAAQGNGRSQWEMLEQVTKPLERRFSSLPGLQALETRTGDGEARLVAVVDGRTDLDALRLDAERRLDAVSGLGLDLTVRLLGAPEPAAEVAVLGGRSAAERTELAEKILLPELSRLAGSGRLEALGLRPLCTRVQPQAAALAAHGLTAADVVDRLRAVGEVVPAGRARDGAQVRPLVVRETVSSLDELGRVRLSGSRGATPLGDVAAIGAGLAEDGAWFRADGEDGVLVRVFAAPQVDGAALARQVGERVAGLAAVAAGRGLRLALLARDGSGGKGEEPVEVGYMLLGDPGWAAAERRGHAVEAAVLASLGGGPRPVRWSAFYQEPERRSVETQVDEAGEGRLRLAFADAAAARDARERIGRALKALAGEDAVAWIEPGREPACTAAGGRGIEVLAAAPTPEQAAALAGRAARAVAERTGLAPLFDPDSASRPGLVLLWDEILLARSGADRATLEGQVKAGLGRLDAGAVEIPGLQPAIRVEPTAAEEPGLLPVRLGAPPADRVVPLDAAAQIVAKPGPAPLLRWGGQPAVRLLFACPGPGAPALSSLLAGVPRAAGEELQVLGVRGRGE